MSEEIEQWKEKDSHDNTKKENNSDTPQCIHHNSYDYPAKMIRG